ncbi:hypothetical protein LTR09_007690 [Extremus antarcticus]|uniref:Uncharacterized protein n=1 Tax=Extremus antarcticus TaxID=702011 RepID=A0AAJ0G7N3_9PEZI|nr:hypothetical protein LTR09_007690 [Extremus antarcticus]
MKAVLLATALGAATAAAAPASKPPTLLQRTACILNFKPFGHHFCPHNNARDVEKRADVPMVQWTSVPGPPAEVPYTRNYYAVVPSVAPPAGVIPIMEWTTVPTAGEQPQEAPVTNVYQVANPTAGAEKRSPQEKFDAPLISFVTAGTPAETAATTVDYYPAVQTTEYVTNTYEVANPHPSVVSEIEKRQKPVTNTYEVANPAPIAASELEKRQEGVYPTNTYEVANLPPTAASDVEKRQEGVYPTNVYEVANLSPTAASEVEKRQEGVYPTNVYEVANPTPTVEKRQEEEYVTNVYEVANPTPTVEKRQEGVYPTNTYEVANLTPNTVEKRQEQEYVTNVYEVANPTPTSMPAGHVKRAEGGDADPADMMSTLTSVFTPAYKAVSWIQEMYSDLFADMYSAKEVAAKDWKAMETTIEHRWNATKDEVDERWAALKAGVLDVMGADEAAAKAGKGQNRKLGRRGNHVYIPGMPAGCYSRHGYDGMTLEEREKGCQPFFDAIANGGEGQNQKVGRRGNDLYTPGPDFDCLSRGPDYDNMTPAEQEEWCQCFSLAVAGAADGQELQSRGVEPPLGGTWTCGVFSGALSAPSAVESSRTEALERRSVPAALRPSPNDDDATAVAEEGPKPELTDLEKELKGKFVCSQIHETLYDHTCTDDEIVPIFPPSELEARDDASIPIGATMPQDPKAGDEAHTGPSWWPQAQNSNDASEQLDDFSAELREARKSAHFEKQIAAFFQEAGKKAQQQKSSDAAVDADAHAHADGKDKVLLHLGTLPSLPGLPILWPKFVPGPQDHQMVEPGSLAESVWEHGQEKVGEEKVGEEKAKMVMGGIDH